MPRTNRRHGDRSDVFPLAAVGCDAEGPTLPVRGVPNAAERGACLRSASAPGVPIWAAPGWRRPSFWRVGRRPGGCARSPTRVRSAAPTASPAECGSVMLCSRRRRPPCLLLGLRPERNLGDTPSQPRKPDRYPELTLQSIEMERKIAQIPAATPPCGRTQDANTTGPVGALLHETQLTGVLDGAKGTARSPGSGVRCPQTSATPISPGGT